MYPRVLPGPVRATGHASSAFVKKWVFRILDLCHCQLSSSQRVSCPFPSQPLAARPFFFCPCPQLLPHAYIPTRLSPSPSATYPPQTSLSIHVSLPTTKDAFSSAHPCSSPLSPGLPTQNLFPLPPPAAVPPKRASNSSSSSWLSPPREAYSSGPTHPHPKDTEAALVRWRRVWNTQVRSRPDTRLDRLSFLCFLCFSAKHATQCVI